MAVATLVCALGVKNGVERATKWMMLALHHNSPFFSVFSVFAAAEAPLRGSGFALGSLALGSLACGSLSGS